MITLPNPVAEAATPPAASSYPTADLTGLLYVGVVIAVLLGVLMIALAVVSFLDFCRETRRREALARSVRANKDFQRWADETLSVFAYTTFESRVFGA